MSAALISVDWGTTSLRCALVDNVGGLIAQNKSERGILKTDGVAFADILLEQIGSWLTQFSGDHRVPILMSGMIGSRQGWQEAAYLRCPATPIDLAQGLLTIDTSGTSLGRCALRIVPGMDQVDINGAPDVMRGEETQVLGALLAAKIDDAAFVLPGTHSKWVVVKERRIETFRTFMTGEVYAALLDATILGRLAEGHADDPEGFQLGVETAIAMHDDKAGPGDLLSMVFSARSRVLLGGLNGASVRSYLSGLLIGAEIKSSQRFLGAYPSEETGGTDLYILSEQPLHDRYACAAALAGLHVVRGVDTPVPVAHVEIARLAGLVA